MPTTPPMLPTMRYDPDRDAVRVCPDRDAPFLVTWRAVEHRVGSHERLSADQLLAACAAQEPYFALVAVRKLLRGEIDPDGHAVVMAHDVKAIEGPHIPTPPL